MLENSEQKTVNIEGGGSNSLKINTSIMEVCLCPQNKIYIASQTRRRGNKIWFLLPKTDISKSIRRQGTEFITVMIIPLDQQDLKLRSYTSRHIRYNSIYAQVNAIQEGRSWIRFPIGLLEFFADLIPPAGP